MPHDAAARDASPPTPRAPPPRRRRRRHPIRVLRRRSRRPAGAWTPGSGSNGWPSTTGRIRLASSIAAMISLRRPSAVVVSSSLNSDISDSSSSAIVFASAVLNESPAPIPPALPPAAAPGKARRPGGERPASEARRGRPPRKPAIDARRDEFEQMLPARDEQRDSAREPSSDSSICDSTASSFVFVRLRIVFRQSSASFSPSFTAALIERCSASTCSSRVPRASAARIRSASACGKSVVICSSARRRHHLSCRSRREEGGRRRAARAPHGSRRRGAWRAAWW